MLLESSEVPLSIRLDSNKQDSTLNDNLWLTYFKQCADGEKKYCEILINDKLKNETACNPKKECSYIGEIYYNAGDFEGAKIYFNKSCEAKDMNGCFFLALESQRFGDIFSAKEQYEKACAKKNMRACYELGVFYEEGKAVRQDYKEAQKFYAKACKYKLARACYNLGALHESGNVTHDLSLAKEFFGKACDLGLQKGCDSYKVLNKSGIPSLYVNKKVFE